MKKTRTSTPQQSTGEADLWRMADTLRGSMDAAEYKHVVLGLIFLKYISDAFGEKHTRLALGKLVSRGKGKRADYILYSKPGIPITLIKAKDNTHHAISDGMQQGLGYAGILGIPGEHHLD